jgi:hypothetical protein
MKRKAFELISSYESEDDGAIGHGEEREGASSGESPAPSGYGGIEGVRDQVENRGQDDLGCLIAQSDVLRNLAEQNRAVIANRRLTFCGRAQRVRATMGSGRQTLPSALSVQQRWRLYLSMLDPHFFAESTIQGEHLANGGVADTGGRYLAERSESLPLSGGQKSSQI